MQIVEGRLFFSAGAKNGLYGCSRLVLAPPVWGVRGLRNVKAPQSLVFCML